MIQSHFLAFKGSRIHYRILDQGPLLTVCFHGFGEDASSFDALAQALKGHTLIAFDLPFHGATDWQQGLHLRKKELLEIILGCPQIGNKSFGLMGYSMGGKIALSVFESIPERISHLVLVAPDGLASNPWHWFGTKTVMGNRLLSYTMKEPGWFITLLHTAKKFGWVNESIFKFVHIYVDDAAMRDKVYRIWTTLRDFRPDVRKIRALMNHRKTPVQMIFGRYDRLCPYQQGAAFLQGFGTQAHLEIIDAGHLLLHPRYLAALTAAFQRLAPFAKTSPA